MLLSIDRLLQLISEGKNLEKISEMANCEVNDVVNMIEEARELLNKHEKASSKRKIIIKKKAEGEPARSDYDDAYIREILNGAELSAIPVNTPLIMYIDGDSSGNPGHSGIGIVIFDEQNRQIGKVSDYIGLRTGNAAEFLALIRALKLAIYFQAGELKVRTDSELIIRQLNDENKSKNSELKKFLDEINELSIKVRNFKVEHISKSQNDKADFLAKKGSEKYR